MVACTKNSTEGGIAGNSKREGVVGGGGGVYQGSSRLY